MKYGIIGLILGLVIVISAYAILGYIVEPGPIKIEITGINYLNALIIIIIFGLATLAMGLVADKLTTKKVKKSSVAETK